MSEPLDTCGCAPRADAEPAIHNRPGLDALDYRIGTHGTLLRRMLRRLAEWSPPEDLAKRPLSGFTTRMTDDPAVALLDAWAVAGDVLSFYQERIANEGFLRTATERRSVLELARGIGYELNPGVAASTHLTWEVERSFEVAGATPPGMTPPPREVVIAAGTKVQSVPGQDELPQTFETSTALVARSDLNALRPRLTVPQAISLGSKVLYIEGIASGFARGDRALIASGPRYDADPATGEPLPGVDVSLLEIKDVVPEPALGRTRLDLEVVPKQPPASEPALPTDFDYVAEPPFVAPLPPPAQPVAPAKIEPPIYVLIPVPLSRDEIIKRILDYAWRNPGLMAQIALLGWNPVALVDFVNRMRLGIDLGPVWVKVQVVPARDVTLPTVVDVFPRSGMEAGRTSNVIVRFSEPMRKASAEGAVSLREKGGGTIGFVSRTYDPASGTVVFDPQGNLGSTTRDITYVVTVDETVAKDEWGNPLAARWESEFVVRDRQPPELIPVPASPDDPQPLEPVPGAEGVPVTTRIVARFGEDVDSKTVTADTFILRDGTGTRVAADRVLSDAGKTITLKPHAPLARSMRYTATLTSGITDSPAQATDKRNGIFPEEWSFTTVKRDPVVPKANLEVYGFRETTAFFGHNAPRWASLPKPAEAAKRDGDPWAYTWDDPPRSVWVDSQGSSLGGDTVQLDREVKGLEAGGWAVFENAQGAAVYSVVDTSARSVADYAMSGRSSQLVLSQTDGTSPCEGHGAPANFRVRESVAHVRSERLRLVELPIEDDLLEGDKEIVLDVMVLGLEKGRLIALRGELVDLPGMIGEEILELAGSTHDGGFTVVRLAGEGLARSYVRRTVTINANVVHTTHGESAGREILGGGDGARPNQRFTLRRPPLTYEQALTPSGAESTLEIRVDGVRWDEAPVLYGLGPRSRDYIVRRSDDNVATVVFGDGEQGARLPTGTENVVATYRTGIGLAGMLDAGRLTLLRERPLGITAVTNPLPASGAAEPEHRDAAKENAPLTVLTMERIVSLRDFEDFARGFAGIDKAQSIAVWQGGHRSVVLTVAGASAGAELVANLRQAVVAAGEPGLDVTVCPYRRRFFDVEAAVRVDPAHLAEDVLKAARQAVLRTFAFERRTFGQPVTDAEVVQVLQAVPGVVATYLRALYALEDDIEVIIAEGVERPLESIMVPRPAEPGGNRFLGAELVLVNPAGVTVTERSS